MIAISAEHLTKKYELFSKPAARIKEFLTLGRKKYHRDLWALRDITFQIKKGSTFGIIGANAAGKSTLLKLLTGTSLPSSGSLSVQGQVSALLELGAGFHPEFSGRDNIYMNGALMGLNREEIRTKFHSIVQFAELTEFIDRPRNNYAAGMYVRLGFAIATSINPDILIIDEVLAVGDQYFQQKCLKRFTDFKKQGKTIILVSHDMDLVKNICDEAIWLDDGLIKARGLTTEVVNRYLNFMRGRVGDYLRKLQEGMLYQDIRQGTGEIRISKVRLLDSVGKEKYIFETGEDMVARIDFETEHKIGCATFASSIYRNDGVFCCGPNTLYDNVCRKPIDGPGTITVTYKRLPLLTGLYSIWVAIFDENMVITYDSCDRICDFEVRTPFPSEGLCFIEHKWNMGK